MTERDLHRAYQDYDRAMSALEGADRERDQYQSEIERLIAERDQLRAEVERMRPVVDAAVNQAECDERWVASRDSGNPDWDMAEQSITGDDTYRSALWAYRFPEEARDAPTATESEA